MNKRVGVVFCVGWALAVGAQESKTTGTTTNQASAAAVVAQSANRSHLKTDVGGDVRVRQEVLGNMPGTGGKLQTTQNYIRYRPRVWGQIQDDDFKLYVRGTDEMRQYFQPNKPDYRWPDEFFLDNLYLDLYHLFNDRVDIRVGRQDFLGPNGPVYGAGRVLCDGTPADGSRTAFMDAIRTTVKLDEKNALDLLAIYNSPDNPLNIGRSHSSSPFDERPLNSIVPGSTGLTEAGGGLYFKSKEFAAFPYELYYLYKRESKATTVKGATLTGRDTHTWGARVVPKLTETVSAEFESAAQVGQKDSGQATSGFMEYAGLTYKPQLDITAKPYITGACYYLSGDKDPSGQDSSWDPLWGRWPQFSELYAYNTIYGLGYWSNLIYPHADAGVEIRPGYKLSSSLGPMYTAEEDGLGGGDGNLRGWLGMIRYDFPLVKNLFGKRGELFGHVTAEVLDPGDYYSSDQWAYFLRWEVNARF